MKIIMGDRIKDAKNTKILRILPVIEILGQLKSALCVFFAKPKFITSFCLIITDTDALGTPLMANNIGASSELKCDINPMIDCNCGELIINTLWSGSNSEHLRI